MKRLKRWQKVVVILFVVLIVLPVIAWVVIDQVASAAVRREIRALEAKGQSLSWDVLAPPEVPDDENAGLIYSKAFPLLSESGSDTENLLLRYGSEPPWDEETLQSLRDCAGETVKASALAEELYWEMARQRVARNKQALDLIEQAAAMDKCWFPVNYRAGLAVPLPHLARLRSSARLLSLRARLRRHDGDLAGAYEDIRTALRLERGLCQPLLVSNLVGGVILRLALTDLKDTLAEDDVNPEAWRTLLAKVNALDRRPEFVAAMQGERALALETIHAGPSAVATLGTPGARPSIGQRLLWSVGRPVLKYNKAHYLRHMTAIVDAVQREPAQAFQDLQAAEASFSGRAQWSAVLAMLLTPAVGRAYESHATCEADQALARTTLALKLHKHQHGEYPESLDALVPEVLTTVPGDPFTGKPLFYRRTEKGFLLYSVGRDREDNGGNETPPDEHDRDQGVDIVWTAEK